MESFNNYLLARNLLYLGLLLLTSAKLISHAGRFNF